MKRGGKEGPMLLQYTYFSVEVYSREGETF